TRRKRTTVPKYSIETIEALQKHLLSYRDNLGAPGPAENFSRPAIEPRSIATIIAARGVEASASRSSIASRHRATSGRRAWSARPRSLGWVDHATRSTPGAAARHGPRPQAGLLSLALDCLTARHAA